MTATATRAGLLLAAAALVAGGPDVRAASTDVNVKELIANGRVLASFSAPGAFNDETRRVLQSGLPLTFRYSVQLRQGGWLWFDRTLAETVVEAQATYDGLAAQYPVLKLRDGRVTKSDRLTSETDVRAWLTAFDQVAMDTREALRPNQDYYLRVRLWTSPRPSIPLWPLSRDDGSGRRDFTFIR